MTAFLFLIEQQMKKYFLILILLGCLGGLEAAAQLRRQSYPQGYFILPIYPGQKNTLSGAMGDLRANHFHAGIDIRTQSREGLPVVAAADGYVSRIKVQTGGYGNVVFIKHPNGMTTVYGHLLNFAEPMGLFLRQEQYKNQSFEIELIPKPDQFVVKQGDLIGLSGNSGGSGGPHLHFEIRDEKENYLNPLFFGFEEISDQTNPAFQSLAIRAMSLDGRVNDEFERVIFKPIRSEDGSYVLSQPVRAHGTLGIELLAYDFMDGTPYRNGLNCIEIKVDGREIFTYNMAAFPNAATRDYNNLIDYATEQKTGSRFYRCYNPDGNTFDLYKTNGYRGNLQINDTLAHEVKITIFDAYENASTLRFSILGQTPSSGSAPVYPTGLVQMSADLTENILKITAQNVPESEQIAVFFNARKSINLPAAYARANESVYLLDLRIFLPDTVQIAGQKMGLNMVQKMIPGRENTYTGDGYAVRFYPESLFDTLYLSSARNGESIRIANAYTPAKDYFTVNFTPQQEPLLLERTHAYLNQNGRLRYQGGKWKTDGSIQFSAREFGDFELKTDTLPPKIRLAMATSDRIAANISDGLSGVQSWRATVNNQWVLMNYDYKRNLIWSEKAVDSTNFEGELVLEITDRAGNIATLRTEITEYVPQPKIKKTNGTKNRRKGSSVSGQRPKRKRR